MVARGLRYGSYRVEDRGLMSSWISDLTNASSHLCLEIRKWDALNVIRRGDWWLWYHSYWLVDTGIGSCGGRPKGRVCHTTWLSDG